MDCDIYGCQDEGRYRIRVYKKRKILGISLGFSYVRAYSLCKPHERQIEGLMASLQLMVKDKDNPERLDIMRKLSENKTDDRDRSTSSD